MWPKGRRQTQEHSTKISQRLRQVLHTPEAQAKRRGRVLTEEHKRKISQALLGKLKSPETRAKLSSSLTGRTRQLGTKTAGFLGHNHGMCRKCSRVHGHLKHSFPRNIPTLQPSGPMAYILGVLKGDGHVGHNGTIRLHVLSETFAKKFAVYLKQIGFQSPKHTQGERYFSVVVHSVVFARWYKSLTPRQLRYMILSYEKEFLCGFYESEGSLAVSDQSWHGHVYNIWKITISNTQAALAETTAELLKGQGFHPRLYCYAQSRGRKPLYLVKLHRTQEVKDFLTIIQPCIRNGGLICVA